MSLVIERKIGTSLVFVLVTMIVLALAVRISIAVQSNCTREYSGIKSQRNSN